MAQTNRKKLKFHVLLKRLVLRIFYPCTFYNDILDPLNHHLIDDNIDFLVVLFVFLLKE